MSSNTPIEALAEDLKPDDGRDTIVFLIDLWDRKGGIPRSLDEVLWRQKCIQYGSRKEAAVNVVNAYEKKGREAQHSAAKARSVSSDVRAPA